VTTARLEGWSRAPAVGVIVPAEGDPGWIDAAFWCALLGAWGIPARAAAPRDAASAAWSTLIVPAACVDGGLRETLVGIDPSSLLVVGGGDAGPTVDGAHRFTAAASTLDAGSTEDIVDRAYDALLAAAVQGLVGLWRGPDGADAALVVDGDVDHPTGVDPECARYVAPAIETMRRARYPAYGIFAAAANVDAEPESFPPGADYYNHSFSHPYSHWNAAAWESLDEPAMAAEIERSDEVFRRRLGRGDQALFRLPHFQMEAAARSYDVLERLGYRAESSVGANHSVTGGLPFHPAIDPWSARPEDAAYARSHPDPSRRRRLLQLPISTDPTDPAFPNGCCSYNTLAEGVRERTAAPEAYEDVLEAVVASAVGRRGLAHLFIDPPDAGYGRLPGDAPDYASAVERWLARAVARDDVATLSTAQLTTWWLAREDAVGNLAVEVERGTLVVRVPDPPPGTTLLVRPPGGEPTIVPLEAA
jgi:hypothetical protein